MSISQPQRRAFTLIELLVVIAVIALLAAIIFPVSQSLMERAKTTQCLNQMRQIGVATLAFTADNDGTLPLSSHQRKSWAATLQPYSGKKILFRCPKDENKAREYSYVLNDRLLPLTPVGDPGLSLVVRLTNPRTMLLFAEAAADASGDHLHTADYAGMPMSMSAFRAQVGVQRHAGSANYLFVDGHVETLTPAAVEKLLDPKTALTGPSNSEFLGGENPAMTSGL